MERNEVCDEALEAKSYTTLRVVADHARYRNTEVFNRARDHFLFLTAARSHSLLSMRII